MNSVSFLPPFPLVCYDKCGLCHNVHVCERCVLEKIKGEIPLRELLSSGFSVLGNVENVFHVKRAAVCSRTEVTLLETVSEDLYSELLKLCRKLLKGICGFLSIQLKYINAVTVL